MKIEGALEIDATEMERADVSNEEGSLRRVLSRCKRLATLILSHCPVSDDVLSAFAPFGPTLRVLILTSWYVHAACVAHARAVCACVCVCGVWLTRT
jgi:hypothetical protein